MFDIVNTCFKNATVIEGYNSYVMAKSPAAASSLLVKKFGNNAEGVIGMSYSVSEVLKRTAISDVSEVPPGHAFNFVINDGKVRFFDGQNEGSGINTRVDDYWKLWDPAGTFQIARLDNAELIEEEIAKLAGNT